MKRIHLVGPSSTGKTTLINILAKKLSLEGPAVVREVARDVMATQGYSRRDVGSLEMQQAIMVAHLKKEAEGRLCPIQICDRSAVDPIVYAVLTSNGDEEARRRRDILVNSLDFQLALQNYRNETFLLLAPVTEWQEDDGVRLIEQQSQCFEAFQVILGELGIHFREIGPDMRFLEERLITVLGLLRL
ncbi:AAA domain-containing protein [Lyophyllum atratum]|nr:AAA domain-containing protein [Lyophyllum atratum]